MAGLLLFILQLGYNLRVPYFPSASQTWSGCKPRMLAVRLTRQSGKFLWSVYILVTCMALPMSCFPLELASYF